MAGAVQAVPATATRDSENKGEHMGKKMAVGNKSGRKSDIQAEIRAKAKEHYDRLRHDRFIRTEPIAGHGGQGTPKGRLMHTAEADNALNYAIVLLSADDNRWAYLHWNCREAIRDVAEYLADGMYPVGYVVYAADPDSVVQVLLPGRERNTAARIALSQCALLMGTQIKQKLGQQCSLPRPIPRQGT